MIPARRTLPSLGSLLRDLLFLVRMRASERRFRRHDAAWRRHRAAENRHLDRMAAEAELRAGLCERRAASRSGRAECAVAAERNGQQAAVGKSGTR